VAVIAALAGCSVPQHFIECQDDTSCGLHAGGRCLTNDATAHKFCAYPDSTCPDGYRWSDHDVESSISGACVAESDGGLPNATLTVMVGGNGSGSVTSDPAGINCPGTCTASFTPGTKVTLSETASSSVFLGWSDACSGTTSCLVTLDYNKRVGALFGIPGSNIWLVQLNGSKAGTVTDARVTPDGDIVAVGFFNSTMKIGTTTLTAVGNGSGFVAKLRAADGAPVWIKQFSASSIALVSGVDVDPSGNVFVIGTYNGVGTFNGQSATSNGDDLFVAKLDANTGAEILAIPFGSPSYDEAAGIVVDSAGDAEIAGTFGGTMTFGGTSLTSNASGSAFGLKFSGANGGHIWSKVIGGANYDKALAIARDAAGNVAIAGYTTGSVNFGGGTRLVPSGKTAYFVAKYASANGAYLVDKMIGTDGNVTGALATMDDAGNFYMGGAFTGSLALGGPSPLTNPGSAQAFLVKYSAAGSHQWSQEIASTMGSGISALSVDSNGNLLVGGFFFGSVSLAGNNLSAAGDSDIFVAHVQSASGVYLGALRLGGTAGETANVVRGATNGDVFVGGRFEGFSEFGGSAVQSSGPYDGFALLSMPLD
jgi:hypothetical protein